MENDAQLELMGRERRRPVPPFDTLAERVKRWAERGVYFGTSSWKYEGWLNGFNGGPSRRPTMRLNDAMMKQLRNALIQSGIKPTDSHDREFFVGRNPVQSIQGTRVAAE